jgi:iron complex outermembrane receptor protein
LTTTAQLFTAILTATLLAGVAAADPDPAEAEPTGPGAEDEPREADEIIVIDPARPEAGDTHADRVLAEPEMVTRIRVDSELPQSATIAELLTRAAGVQVRGVGGLGGFASISVRGLGAGHTPVLIDGIALPALAAAVADLSRLELHSFGSVELYRGAVPASLASAGLGGALNLVTGVGPAAEGERGLISVGGGSFGARHLRTRYLGGDSQLGYQLGAGYGGAEGDYPFYNDNGTNLNLDDDFIDERTNNGFDRLDGFIRARERRGHRSASGGARLGIQRQGLPGRGSRQNESARLDSASGLLDLAVETDRAAGRPELAARASGFVMFDRQHLFDRDGEVGLGAGEAISETLSAGIGAGASRRGQQIERASLAVDARLDGFGERDPVAGVAGVRGLRLGAALTAAAELRVADRAWLVPQLRAEALETRPRDRSAMEASVMSRRDLHLAPRLAALVRPSLDLSIKASAGYAVRHPTLIELFGDRGYVAGNVELRPERGPAADLGLAWAPAMPPRGFRHLLVEAAVFWARPTDAIVYLPTAGQVAKPFNFDDAIIAGLEAHAAASILSRLDLAASYTFLDARDDATGAHLPHRAGHTLYARAGSEAGPVAGWIDFTHASGNFLDRANLFELPARRLWGAGARLAVSRRTALTAEVKNLTDNIVEDIALDPPPRPDLASVPQPISDFFGYPLPGRAFYASAVTRF